MTTFEWISTITAVIIPGVLWAAWLSYAVREVKNNHLTHIEANTATTNERLIEIATILRERT